MASADTTPSAVRSSGRTRRGSRAASARRMRFSCFASRKFGSRVALTAEEELMAPYKPSVNKGYLRDTRHMSSTYHEGSRRLQDRFDTRRLADRLDERFVQRRVIGEGDKAFIEKLDMFFIATADAEGKPQCSYKGGDPGFVKVLDETTLAFPNYDGNGMYLTMGNLLVNQHVGLLFIDFAGNPPRRLRVNGTASVVDDDPLLAEYEQAQFIVRVHATEV